MNTHACCDFSEPGHDAGALPEGYELWRRGVVYTRMKGQPVRQLTCCVLGNAGPRGYAPLYERVRALLRAETRDATAIRHGWRTIGAYVFMFVTGEVGATMPEVPYPTVEELAAPRSLSGFGNDLLRRTDTLGRRIRLRAVSRTGRGVGGAALRPSGAHTAAGVVLRDRAGRCGGAPVHPPRMTIDCPSTPRTRPSGSPPVWLRWTSPDRRRSAPVR